MLFRSVVVASECEGDSPDWVGEGEGRERVDPGAEGVIVCIDPVTELKTSSMPLLTPVGTEVAKEPATTVLKVPTAELWSSKIRVPLPSWRGLDSHRLRQRHQNAVRHAVEERCDARGAGVQRPLKNPRCSIYVNITYRAACISSVNRRRGHSRGGKPRDVESAGLRRLADGCEERGGGWK